MHCGSTAGRAQAATGSTGSKQEEWRDYRSRVGTVTVRERYGALAVLREERELAWKLLAEGPVPLLPED